MLGEGRTSWAKPGSPYPSNLITTALARRQMWSSRLRSGEITPDRARSADLTTSPTGCRGRKSIALPGGQTLQTWGSQPGKPQRPPLTQERTRITGLKEQCVFS